MLAVANVASRCLSRAEMMTELQSPRELAAFCHIKLVVPTDADSRDITWADFSFSGATKALYNFYCTVVLHSPCRHTLMWEIVVPLSQVIWKVFTFLPDVDFQSERRSCKKNKKKLHKFKTNPHFRKGLL